MFEPKTIHDQSDWIASVKNKGESFQKYVEYKPNLVNEQRQTICIQPLDETITKGFMEVCKKFIEAFYYGVKVEILKAIDVKTLGTHTRQHFSGQTQYHAYEILKAMFKFVP